MKFYKFRTLRDGNKTDFNRLREIICDEQLHCASFDSLNDPFEGILGFIPKAERNKPVIKNVEFLQRLSEDWERHRKTLKGRRICSLSASFNNVLMWSHYAAGGQGVCVEIELDENTPGLQKVEYVTKIEELPVEGKHDFLLTKLSCWKYEDEWRLFQKNKKFSVKGCVRGVIMGGRINSEGIRLVESVVIKRRLHCSVAQPTTKGVIKLS